MTLNKAVYRGMSNEFLKKQKAFVLDKGNWVKHQ